MNQRVRLIVSDLKERRKVHSDADCARIINVEKADLSRMMSGKRPVSQRCVDGLLSNFPEINEEWLRTGEGEMLKSTSTASNHSVSIAGEEIKENNIHVNTDDTLAMLIAEMAAQRKMTEKILDQNTKILEQNSELIASLVSRVRTEDM